MRVPPDTDAAPLTRSQLDKCIKFANLRCGTPLAKATAHDDLDRPASKPDRWLAVRRNLAAPSSKGALKQASERRPRRPAAARFELDWGKRAPDGGASLTDSRNSGQEHRDETALRPPSWEAIGTRKAHKTKRCMRFASGRSKTDGASETNRACRRARWTRSNARPRASRRPRAGSERTAIARGAGNIARCEVRCRISSAPPKTPWARAFRE